MRTNLSSITRALETNPSASKTLKQKFVEKEWLDLIANPTEEQLVTLVLGRIEQDVNQYGDFIAMLRDIEGMDLIVNMLTMTSLLLGRRESKEDEWARDMRKERDESEGRSEEGMKECIESEGGREKVERRRKGWRQGSRKRKEGESSDTDLQTQLIRVYYLQGPQLRAAVKGSQ